MYRNLEQTEEDKGEYCTFLFERKALKFLDAHTGVDPFFLNVPFNAPHGSSALEPEIRSTIQAPKEFQEMYPPLEKEFERAKRFR